MRRRFVSVFFSKSRFSIFNLPYFNSEASRTQTPRGRDFQAQEAVQEGNHTLQHPQVRKGVGAGVRVKYTPPFYHVAIGSERAKLQPFHAAEKRHKRYPHVWKTFFAEPDFFPHEKTSPDRGAQILGGELVLNHNKPSVQQS